MAVVSEATPRHKDYDRAAVRWVWPLALRLCADRLPIVDGPRIRPPQKGGRAGGGDVQDEGRNPRFGGWRPHPGARAPTVREL